MKKFLGMFCVAILLSACSTSDSTGGAFGGSECDSAEAMSFRENATDRVFFGFDEFAVNSKSAEALKVQAKWLNKNSKVKVLVEGHADERGTEEYNMALGERRANSVKRYLVSQGVDAKRITTTSYGKSRPAVKGSNESAFAQNRRSVTLVKVD